MDSGNGFGTRVFWTAVIPDDDVQVNPGAGTAEMHISNLDELDYYSPEGFGDLASLGPTWQTGYFASTVNIDVVWNGPVTRRVNVKDAANGFAGTFNENQATVTWSAQSESGFDFTSNPGNFSTSVPEIPGVSGVTAPLYFFAQVAHERNGIFFPEGSGAGPSSIANGQGARDLAFATLALPHQNLGGNLVSGALVQGGTTAGFNNSTFVSPAQDTKIGAGSILTANPATTVRIGHGSPSAIVADPAAINALFTEIGQQGRDVLFR